MAPKNDASKNDYSKTNFIENISEDVAKLTSDLRQPDKFAQIFCDAAKSQKSIDGALKNVVIELLEKDIDTRDAVKSIIKKIDWDYTRVIFGKVGFVVWSVSILIVEAIILKFSR